MLLFAATLIAAAPVPAVAAPDGPRAIKPPATAPTCRRTTSYYAWLRDRTITPRKLTELPPATTYMAVYRIIDGCEAPLTLSDYRRNGRR